MIKTAISGFIVKSRAFSRGILKLRDSPSNLGQYGFEKSNTLHAFVVHPSGLIVQKMSNDLDIPLYMRGSLAKLFQIKNVFQVREGHRFAS